MSSITMSVYDVKIACLLALEEIKRKEKEYLYDEYFKRKNKFSWLKKVFGIKVNVPDPTQEQLSEILVDSFSIAQTYKYYKYIEYTKSHNRPLLQKLLNMADLKYHYAMQLDKDDFVLIYPYLNRGESK